MFLDRFKSFKSYKTETTPCRIKLSSNENPFDLPQWLKNKIGEEVKNIPFQRYPDPTSKELKEVIADFYGVKPENLVLGNGSDELIQLLTIIIGNPDQPVMYPVPTFPMYQVSADIVGKKKIEFPLDENFQLSREKIDEALEKKPVLAFFASPNNPTGNSFDRELIKYVADRGVFTVVDEAYIDFSDKEDFISESLKRENLVVLRTMSKIGLAGIRLGTLIAREDIAMEIDKTRPPFNITYPTQVIGKIVLSEGRDEIKRQVEIIKKERDKLLSELGKIDGIKVYPSDANFVLIKVHDGDALHRALIEKGILVRNMSHLPYMENCLRISVGKPEENEIFINVLKELVG
ncbi:MAG TPA: histidinol-phosphate transaminase [Persephonella sp.]|uniref:Histidinol-phosphate aminotransferase n=1 Tax=Persephonella marina (strain DSM 14350 / EX-H1) TaxID=123214 RepID=C0QSP1_PERMH|nr:MULTISPECIES: histidinol-phosphate transaminase [Persephonella]ACO03314.1 histidinol-phosphate transaminase [Persephonella marina EX-H1]HCB69434.1 histidinol-phosphate transaminase [Persephonella sp.]